MVYDTAQQSGQKKERFVARGKLIGISSDSEKCKPFDKDKGLFGWIRLSLITGVTDSGESEYLNVTAFDINMEEMANLKLADKLLKDGNKPFVQLCHYTTEVEARDKENNLIMEEKEVEREGKTIFVQKAKKYINHRMSADDVKTSFKVLKNNTDNLIEVETEKV